MTRAGLEALADRIASRLRAVPLEGRAPRDELALAGHVAARAWGARGQPGSARRALLDLALLEAALLVLGRGGVAAAGAALYPLTFLPDYHGPHFHRALRRLLVPHEGPFVVHFAVTGRCPWRCTYCFSSSGGPGAKDAGDGPLERVAAELAARRVPIVLLGGGEPLGPFERTLRLVEILSRGCEVRLATSGAGLNAARASRLRAAGLSVLAVSLDAGERGRVDAERGEGAFDVALRALRVAAGADLLTLVTSVVGRGALPSDADVHRLLARVREANPRAVTSLLPEFATGRGASRGFRSPEEYAPTARRLARAVRRGGHKASVLYGARMDAIVGCVGAAHRQVFIDAEGNLSVCVSAATFGNLLTEPFDEVWRRMLEAPARYKRGYFCAHAAARSDAGERGAAATEAALGAFFAGAPDALLQRVIDRAGPALARIVPGG